MPDKLLASDSEIKFFSILGVVLVILLVLSFIIGSRVQRGNVSSPARVATVPNAFATVSITARAAYVFDVRTGKVLYEKNGESRMPLASLTKVMTALTAIDLAKADSTVVVSREAIDTDGDSGLALGERWSLKNLLDFSLTSSSNDGVRAVGMAIGALTNPDAATSAESEGDFVGAMNKKADEIGMKNTYYFNDTGLDETNEKGGAYGTAKDMATLFAYILATHPELMDATRKSQIKVSSYSATHIAENTDTVVDQIPNLKASKTGFTDLAGGNLVVAFDPEIGRPIVVAVLGSTEEGRFSDVLQLVDAAMTSVATTPEAK